MLAPVLVLAEPHALPAVRVPRVPRPHASAHVPEQHDATRRDRRETHLETCALSLTSQPTLGLSPPLATLAAAKAGSHPGHQQPRRCLHRSHPCRHRRRRCGRRHHHHPTTPHLTLPHLTTPHLTLPYLTAHYLATPHVTPSLPPDVPDPTHARQDGHPTQWTLAPTPPYAQAKPEDHPMDPHPDPALW